MSLFELGRLTEEDRFTLSRIEDLVRQTKGGRPRFSVFLDTRQQALAEAVLQNADPELLYAFSGGYESAERRMLGISRYDPPEPFPFETLTVSAAGPRSVDKSAEPLFTHRDLLGALTHLGITRESLGDLVTGSASAVIFVAAAVADTVRSELTRVGRVSVRVTEGGQPEQIEEGETVTGTVSSLRLDAVLSLGLRLSREKAQSLIASGRVQRNHAPILSASKLLEAGDLLSIAGFGRIRLEALGGESRKGRQFVHLRVLGSRR